jgi:hypothetical protein
MIRGIPLPKYIVALFILAGLPLNAQFVIAGDPPAHTQSTSKLGPDCSGGWPTNMAQATLKNAGLLRNEEIDFSKSKTTRLASEQISKDLWHQIYLVTFHKKSGEDVQAMAIHDASMEECSMTEVRVYVISKTL